MDPQIPQASEESKSPLSLPFTIVLFVLFTATALSFFFPNIYTKKSVISESITATSTWKTYTNIDLGFSFEYPQDWQENNEGLITFKKNWGKVEKIDGHDFTGSCKISFLHSSDFTNKTEFNSVVADLLFSLKLDIGTEGIISTSTVNIANKESVRVNWSHFASTSSFYIPLKRGALDVGLTCGSDVKTIGEETLNQIFSTLKFTQ